LEKISRAVVAAGARTVNIPDTVGYSTPKEYGALIGKIVRALGDCAIVSVHCHDDLGLAVANSLAAIEAGARQVECTINGIDPRTVGVPEGKLVLGKHSGRHALNQRAKDLGFELTREELDDLYHRFTAVADHRKKGLMDQEIATLIRDKRAVGVVA